MKSHYYLDAVTEKSNGKYVPLVINKTSYTDIHALKKAVEKFLQESRSVKSIRILDHLDDVVAMYQKSDIKPLVFDIVNEDYSVIINRIIEHVGLDDFKDIFDIMVNTWTEEYMENNPEKVKPEQYRVHGYVGLTEDSIDTISIEDDFDSEDAAIWKAQNMLLITEKILYTTVTSNIRGVVHQYYASDERTYILDVNQAPSGIISELESMFHMDEGVLNQAIRTQRYLNSKVDNTTTHEFIYDMGIIRITLSRGYHNFLYQIHCGGLILLERELDYTEAQALFKALYDDLRISMSVWLFPDNAAQKTDAANYCLLTKSDDASDYRLLLNFSGMDIDNNLYHNQISSEIPVKVIQDFAEEVMNFINVKIN